MLVNFNKALIAVVLIVSVLPIGRCFAWNDRTHMLIAYLAYKELAAERQEEIHELLKQHPHYESFLLKDKPEECPEGLWVFMRAALWSDFVNNDEHRAEYHRMRWHFINIPYFPAESGTSMAELKLTSFSPNILTAIDENADVFSERYSSARRKAIALSWLLHLYGDVHQPLHCVNLYSDRFPTGDQGGNRIAVRDGEKLTKLHAYWDNLLGEDRSYSSIQEFAQTIADDELADDINDQGKWPSWAKSSHDLAVKHVYLNGRLPLVEWQSEYQSSSIADQVPLLPEEYKNDATRVAKHQVHLAAKRLASFLR